MRIRTSSLPGVLLMIPTAHYDERGFFTRTFDNKIASQWGIEGAAFIQDSQSRSRQGVIRGLHGRAGSGEAKLVRCAHGAIYDVVVDARPDSPTFGRHEVFTLDDELFWHLYVPPGMLHGFQALSPVADVCYRINRPHDPSEDLSVRFDDAELAIEWPLPPALLSRRDAAAGSWLELKSTVSAGDVRLE